MIKPIATAITALAATTLVCYGQQNPAVDSQRAADADQNPVTSAEMKKQKKAFQSLNWDNLRIKNKDGEEIGETEKVVVNDEGVIQYVVLRTGEVLEASGRLIAVPWKALQFEAPEQDRAIESANPTDRAKGDLDAEDTKMKKPLFAWLDADDEKIETAPEYDEDIMVEDSETSRNFFSFWNTDRGNNAVQGAE